MNAQTLSSKRAQRNAAAAFSGMSEDAAASCALPKVRRPNRDGSITRFRTERHERERPLRRLLLLRRGRVVPLVADAHRMRVAAVAGPARHFLMAHRKNACAGEVRIDLAH